MAFAILPTPAAGAVVVDVGVLEPEATITIELTAQVVSPIAPGTTGVANQGQVSGDNFAAFQTDDPAAGGAADPTATPVWVPIDLAVSASESVDPVASGPGAGTLIHTLTVTNAGSELASAVTLTVTTMAPSGVTVDSVTPSQGSLAGSAWSLGDLGLGDSANVTVVYTVGPTAAAAPDAICATATVTGAAQTLVATGDDAASVCTSIGVVADLSIALADSADPPPTSALTYTITVSNAGPSAAAGVVVTDPLPAGVTYAGDTCGGSAGNPWTWNVGGLAAGATVACNLAVTIAPAPPAMIVNTASVTGTTTDDNLADNSSSEVTTLDAAPPTVAWVTTSEGADVADCATVHERPSGLRLGFSEGMDDPPGNATLHDVTNPAAYLLVRPGPDLAFSTLSCLAVAGDDVAVPLASVHYDGEMWAATVVPVAPLEPGQYRLFACDALRDDAGNDLDGDGNGLAGGDFQLGFRVDPNNAFRNGHFDCDLTDWTPDAAVAGEIDWDSTDVEGAAGSGSAAMTNLVAGLDSELFLSQCAEAQGATGYALRARLRLDAASGVLAQVMACELYAEELCEGGVVKTATSLAFPSATGSWLAVEARFVSPPDAASVRCSVGLVTTTGAAFEAFFDALVLDGSAPIFDDGFETGDTTAWTKTAP